MFTITTENKDFTMRFSRSKKQFSYSKYSQYDCIVEFINNMGMTILKLTMSELNYLDCVNNFMYYADNGGSVISDNIWLNEDKDGRYFISISDSKYGIEEYDDYLGEKDTYRIFIGIYQKTMMGNKLRLGFYCSYEGIYDFVDKAYWLIGDLPYFEELSKKAMYDMVATGLL